MLRSPGLADTTPVPYQVEVQGEVLVLRGDFLQNALCLFYACPLWNQPQASGDAVYMGVNRHYRKAKGKEQDYGCRLGADARKGEQILLSLHPTHAGQKAQVNRSCISLDLDQSLFNPSRLHLRQAANLYEELGKYPEAAKKLDQLLKLDPKNKELQDEYLRLRRRTLGTPKPG